MSPKIQICIPCMDTVPTQFLGSIMSLQRTPETSMSVEMGTMIYLARNNLATKAMDNDIEWTMWFDSDMVFPPDTMIRLLNTAIDRRIDILSTVCYRRRPPYSPVLFDKLTIDEKTGWADFTERTEVPDEIFEVAATGFACTLVNTRVFREVRNINYSMFQPIYNNSEDLSFCWRARQAGFKIYADPSLNVGHVGHMVFGKETYKK